MSIPNDAAGSTQPPETAQRSAPSASAPTAHGARPDEALADDSLDAVAGGGIIQDVIERVTGRDGGCTDGGGGFGGGGAGGSW